MKYNEIQEILNKFADAAFAKYGNHGYSAGYFQSRLALMIMDLPQREQEKILRGFKQDQEQYLA